MELKTLKDLEWKDDSGVGFGQVYMAELRLEAIKRINHYRNIACKDGTWTSELLCGAANELQSFLNITEEDLQ